jgi:protein gp37
LTPEDVTALNQLGRAATRSANGRPFLDWVIVGGESGPGHRPMDPAWAEAIAAQCDAAGVPVFVKQDSGPRPGEQGRLSGDLWRLKEFPAAVVAS